MYLLFDIGGTKTRVAYSKDGVTCEEPVVVKTPPAFEDGVQEFAKIAKKVTRGREVHVAAGGVAGPLDRDCTKLINSPNLSGWINQPLRTRLSETLGVPVFVRNDTAIVGLGEAVKGAGKEYDIAVYVTVSTGVGGVRIVNGSIDKRVLGFEIGHQVIDLDKTACPECSPCSVCGGDVDLESMISGSATKRRFGKEPYKIPQSDPLWDELARWLSYGLANTIVHWSPDVVVLGGSMMVGKPAIPIDRVREHLKSALKIFPEHPELKLAELGDFGGLYGALIYAKQRMGQKDV